MCFLTEGLDPERAAKGGTTLAVLGSSYTGKSTLLAFYLNNIIKAKLFDVVMLFTESPNAEPYRKLSNKVKVLNGFHPELMKLAVRINQATDNRYRFLFVLDDVSNVRDMKEIDRAITIYRNSGVSTIVSFQYLKMMNPRQRSSIHRIVFTGNRSPEDRKNLIKTFLSGAIKEPSIVLQDRWFMKNTELTPTGGKYLNYDCARDEITVCKRPRLADI